MAQRNNIDLRDRLVIEEFKRIQQQNLEDIRRMKEGKKPLSEEEMKTKLQAMREQEHTEAKKLLEESQKRKDESVQKLVQNAFGGSNAGEEPAAALGDEWSWEQIKHYVALGGFLLVWCAFIVY